MCAVVQNALNTIRALTPAEQDELFTLMDDEFAPDDPRFVREIERPSDDIDAGRATFISSEDLMASLRAQLDRAP